MDTSARRLLSGRRLPESRIPLPHTRDENIPIRAVERDSVLGKRVNKRVRNYLRALCEAHMLRYARSRFAPRAYIDAGVRRDASGSGAGLEVLELLVVGEVHVDLPVKDLRVRLSLAEVELRRASVGPYCAFFGGEGGGLAGIEDAAEGILVEGEKGGMVMLAVVDVQMVEEEDIAVLHGVARGCTIHGTVAVY